MSKTKYRVVEVYAGTGRSSEPFREWHEAEIALLVDNNALARNTYLHNFPTANYRLVDLSTAAASEIATLANGPVDILLGCPPCQGFSDVLGHNMDDPRNKHIVRFAALVKCLRPQVLAMENVPLAGDSKEFELLIKQLEELDYRWTAGILNAARRGSAQCRQRLVLIAASKKLPKAPQIPDATHGGRRQYFCYSRGKLARITDDTIRMLAETPASRRSLRVELPFQDDQFGKTPIPTVAEVLKGLPTIGTAEADRLNHVAWAHTPKILRRMERVGEGSRWKRGTDHYSQAYGRLHRRGLSRTITTFFPNPGSGRYWHPIENRTLTLREAARLQGFPDEFEFLAPFSHAAGLVGNALDAAIAHTTYTAIRDLLD